MISVDSRGAGEGKTTTGIYPRIDMLRQLDANVLLVVPSQELQNQYERHFHNVSDFRKINSTEYDNVCSRIIEALTQGQQNIVCITHEAWMRLSIPWNIKQHWHLIVDEVIMPFRTVVWTSSERNYIDWSQIMELPDDAVLEDNEVFLPVTIRRDQKDSWSDQISEIQRLKNPDWQTWSKTSSYQNLQSGTAGRAEFVQSLDISHVRGWRTVYIAAAAFERTFMAAWLRMNSESWNTVMPFQKRSLPIALHAPEHVMWSKNKQQKHPEIIIKYTEYVDQVCQQLNLQPLVVRNSSSTNELQNELRIKHNPHGLNHLTDYQAVSLETALVPSSVFQDWLEQQAQMSSEQVITAFSSYMFYQILMRTCLRLQDNTRTCHVFALDFKTISGLAELIDFDVELVSEIDVGFREQPPGRPRNQKPPMSSTERSRKYRELRKTRDKPEKSVTQVQRKPL